ncbi:MAG: sterol desaturase/sphingolipid hydroxylase (fatty acid hydroxylase superfamily) [Halioglobus sp.]|jgi:sterol desaturase/sphingolipid hydroxylase (fatty acid hydroxylase superfamily)
MHDLQFYLDELAKDDLIYLFLPLFFLALLVEFIIDKRKNLQLFERKDTIASLWMTAFVVVVDILPKLAAFILFFYLHSISPFADLIQRQWWAWVLLFFLDDITYYFMHRANHEVRLFWAGHVSHHSAVKMNYATALRQGVMERLHKYAFWIPLPLLGFDPLMIFTMMSLSLFYQFWLHTELVDTLPTWFERFFNTPSHHRVHHASNIRYLDCNHAATLIIWDKLLGTFSSQVKSEPPVYGLTTNITSQNPFFVATHEYFAIAADVRRAKTMRDKLSYLFKAPGWSHDGEDKRAKTLRSKSAAA